ncbi:MAG TPA: HD domain-containing phosphohydrolase [Syntrophorhabdales bacterium]|nr:HD domain-containing phosphohydrolase [Syntrophorhabdales bacterium]
MAGKTRILIVEDEGLIALELRDRLTEMGYEIVGPVPTGQEAIDHAREFLPDVVLMDIILAGQMDGIEASEVIKNSLDIPVIFLTAHADERTLQRAKATQPFGYILKPFNERELQVSIEMALYKYQKEKMAREREEWLSATLTSIGDAVITVDGRSHVTFMNAAAQELTGWNSRDVVGRKASDIFNIIQEDGLMDGRFIPSGTVREDILINEHGREIPVDYNAAPIKNYKGDTTGMVFVLRDISERKAAEERIKYLSFHDKLTDLYSRDYFEEELRRFDTPRELPLSLVMGDVNGLKLVNDVFGHQEGDMLLRKIADALKGSCRKEDMVARWGGDEFVVLLLKTTEALALEFAKRVRTLCGEADGTPIQPSIALGIVTKERADQELRELLKTAEDRMYRNKLMERKSTRSAIIYSLQKTVQEKSLEMGEHAVRLKSVALEVGHAIGLPDDKLDELSLLAMLHDIGKLAISDQILGKPGRLLPEEWEAMQSHLEIGYRIVESTPELAHIGEAVLAHHEWWDGTGYPKRLHGEQIPLISRILAIVDAYDVMTHDRPYRLAVSRDEALNELRQCAGTQFDPQLVDAFVQVVSSKQVEEQI